MPSSAFVFPADAYHFLLKHYPEEKWVDLSYRKQICLHYLKWVIYPQDKILRGKLIDLVKDWRKVEKTRFGGKRTLLERAIRKKLFKVRKREKLIEKNYEGYCKGVRLQQERKTGTFTDEKIKLRNSPENGLRGERVRRMMGKTRASYWTLFPPDGEPFVVLSLKKWCLEQGYDWSHLSKTNNHPGRTYKGWRAVKHNDFFGLHNFKGI